MKVLLPFFMIFLVPLSVVVGYALGGVFTFQTPVLVFGLIPVLDLIIGTYAKNPTPEQETAWKDAIPFRVITILCVPVQVSLVLWGAYAVSLGTMSTMETIGFAVSVGFSSGIMGINVSHELQHRVNLKLEPFLARIILWTVLYMHWAIEHIAGHHRNVATPTDPATARMGESFYAFWPRTVLGGMKSSWDIEAARLRRKGFKVMSVRNRIIRYDLAQAALVVAVWALFGTAAVGYLFLQSIVAFSLLEVVNYVEHYGLVRKEISEGKYEPVTFVHSWNSSNWLTNQFLFNLQRHSDHHYRPDRRYQILRHFDESPQLPTGYAGMLLLAFVPPLWRLVMDHRVKEYRQLAGRN
jgi:alkane 1-monooxygenase